MNISLEGLFSGVTRVILLLFAIIVPFLRSNKNDSSVTHQGQLIYGLFEVGREYEFIEIEDLAYAEFSFEGESVFNLLQKLIAKRKIIEMPVVRQKYRILTSSEDINAPPKTVYALHP